MRRWLWLPLLALAFAPTLPWLWEHWTASIFRNGHGLFVPFVVAYLVREHLKLESDVAPRDSWLGFGFLLPALGLLALDAAMRTQLLSALALVIALPGLSLLLLGARRTRALAFPLAIAAFALPIPAGAITQIHLVLRQITAVGTAWLLPLVGMPVARVGTRLSVPDLTVEVADNCSGFATLFAAVLTALVLAHLVGSRRRRLALLLGAVPLALVCNTVRVAALVLIARYWGPDVLDTQVHPGSGMILFTVVIVALFALAGPEALRAKRALGTRVQLSQRWSAAIAALAALTLVPVGIHSYARLQRDDCASPSALVPPQGAVDPARAAYLQQAFEPAAWREGRLPASDGAPELEFAVVRSYDPKLLYYRGTRRLWHDVEAGGDRLAWLESDDGRVPIVASRIEGSARTGEGTVIQALLVYDDRPVTSGWKSQLRAAPGMLVSGAKPMTMFAVRANGRPEQLAASVERANAFLADSWRNYRALCR